MIKGYRTARAFARSISSVHSDEILHFDSLAPTWWDLNGSSALLHKMNPPRISFIKSHLSPSIVSHDWLRGHDVLDVGCGGGILSESLARLGARTTGLDASSAGIMVAKEHAKQSDLSISYINTSAEEYVSTGAQFDVICAMEIIEHVKSPPAFLETMFKLLKSQGWLFISTIEASLFARILTCTIAEDILRLVPSGTHDPHKFVPKEGMKRWVDELGGQVIETRGIIYDPLMSKWRLLSPGQTWGEQCNYVMAIRKL